MANDIIANDGGLIHDIQANITSGSADVDNRVIVFVNRNDFSG